MHTFSAPFSATDNINTVCKYAMIWHYVEHTVQGIPRNLLSLPSNKT